MLCPLSPFAPNFNTRSLFNCDAVNDGNLQIQFKHILQWLCTTPTITTFRVNTIIHTTDEIYNLILKFLSERNIHVRVEKHPILEEVIVIHHAVKTELNLENINKEIIVDTECASAVLRGANVYAPGVMAMMSGTTVNEVVKIYADVSKKCRKGLQKLYDDPNKFFIGIGLVKMNRHQLYGENLLPSGIAIEVLENTSGCPVLGSQILPQGSAILQNLPSIICVHTLHAQPDETILDMCASPGNKTTHIAALMKNKGTLMAIDKTPTKIKQLEKTCDLYNANVRIFQADSTKIVNFDDNAVNPLHGPPFSKETFDRILLDAPCSALGKRPQLHNSITEKVLKSYVPLQKKLFENAVHLLKTNGTLVYSTCTVTIAENEGIVSWALKTFSCLRLVSPEVKFGSNGLECGLLTSEERNLIQRFGPDTNVDSVGFFIARFVKILQQ